MRDRRICEDRPILLPFHGREDRQMTAGHVDHDDDEPEAMRMRR